MGGSFDCTRRPDARESKNSPTICETDLPRRPASALAVRTSSASIRNVSFVFMPYTLSVCVRLVNPVFQRRWECCLLQRRFYFEILQDVQDAWFDLLPSYARALQRAGDR